MNVNEYGVDFLLSTGYDMSGFTALSLTFVKPDKTTLTVTNPAVTLGADPVETTAGDFVADHYVKYIFVDGDVDQTGVWSVRLTYRDAGPRKLISDIVRFTIYP